MNARFPVSAVAGRHVTLCRMEVYLTDFGRLMEIAKGLGIAESIESASK